GGARRPRRGEVRRGGGEAARRSARALRQRQPGRPVITPVGNPEGNAAAQLPRWIHKMCPSWDFRNRAPWSLSRIASRDTAPGESLFAVSLVMLNPTQDRAHPAKA